DYADRLLDDLETLKGWPEPIKEMQRNWIGRSEGALIKFNIKNTEEKLEVFTTRPDTLFGATYCVIAPEHGLIKNLESKIENLVEIQKYLEQAKNKSDLERTELQKEKSGVEVKGLKAVNPANNEELPIFVADYVLGGYGTGAIMAVPGHDDRDWIFAMKYNLPIKQVVAPKFVQTDNPPQVDKPTKRRKTVHVILERSSDSKILLLKWKGAEWKNREPKTFIIGGIENGENIVEAAVREVQEETGYTKINFIKKLSVEVHTEYYAAHKNENRQADISILHFILDDDSAPKMSAEELAKHEPVWIDKNEVENFVNVVDGPFIWNWFLSGDKAYTENGVAMNSDFLNDLPTPEAKTKIISWLVEKGLGQKKVQYKLRDWVFSRQRYWGEPIPLVHCDKCNWQPVPEDQLPLELPKVKKYEPSGTGESPLANITDWVNTTCPKCGGSAKRETNTMPQWAGSCWYYLRYIDPHNDNALVEKAKEKYWSPVDLYVGGAEQATRHLIYARFWHKFLFDIGVVSYSEPFTRLQNLGLILAEDGRKMSKRWNNVINPDDIVAEFGADSMRLYEMFMGPFDQPCAWSTQGVVGVRRFLEKVWSLSEKVHDEKASDKSQNLLHKTIKKISSDIELMHYNTSIAQLMIFTNELAKEEKINKEIFAKFLQLLAPFAPHICEELWSELDNKNSVFTSTWPQFDATLAQDSEMTLAVQVNGKLRDTLVVLADISEIEAKAKALALEKIQKWLEGKVPKKVIYVKGKLISIVI
ncbi:MAG: class I tRNA ligase family protein, partial [bacterium]|nr:class I tRNA ligase family protein [bacterium]